MPEPLLLRDQLLATKFFVPSSSHPVIPRPHLSTLLNQGLRRKLTLISAPAGFGKTTLLSTWVQSFSQENREAPRVAWVSLDEGDNEPVLFWTYALSSWPICKPCKRRRRQCATSCRRSSILWRAEPNSFSWSWTTIT